LRRITVPANRRTGGVLVDERHRKRLGRQSGPLGESRANWPQKFRNGWRWSIAQVIRGAVKGHAAAGHHTSHFERRKGNLADVRDQLGFFGDRETFVAIGEAVRHVDPKQRHVSQCVTMPVSQ
jgi:hypothetical protein